MRFRAAVLHRVDTPLHVQEVEMAALRPGDVLGRVRASGLCHTDLEVIRGEIVRAARLGPYRRERRRRKVVPRA